MEVFVGTLAVAVLGGVLAFAREQIKNAREDVEWYRKELIPTVEKQQDVIEKIAESVKSEKDAGN